MDIRRMIEATIRVNEDEIGDGMPPIEPQGAEVTPDAPVGMEAEEAIVPEITPELATQLAQEIGLDPSITPEEFMQGLTVEVEHFDSLGGDMLTVAKVAADHLKEFPGKNYYAALQTMEDGLRGEEEVFTDEAPVDAPVDVPVDVPMDDAPMVEEPRLESKEPIKEEENIANSQAPVKTEKDDDAVVGSETEEVPADEYAAESKVKECSKEPEDTELEATLRRDNLNKEKAINKKELAKKKVKK